jgi:hypothetical protein
MIDAKCVATSAEVIHIYVAKDMQSNGRRLNYHLFQSTLYI